MRSFQASFAALAALTIIGFTIGSASSVLGHPADSLDPAELDVEYGTPNYGSPASSSFGDVVFYSPYPAPEELSSIEKYMLNGTTSSAEGYGRTAWWSDIMAHVSSYYMRYNEIPETLDIEAVRAVAWQPNSVNAAVMAWLKNPLTDQEVKLRSAEFSPGDMYIKALSQDEIEVLCGQSVLWDNSLRRHVRVDPLTGEERAIEMLTPVFYVRMYGQNDVIMSRIHFGFRTVE